MTKQEEITKTGLSHIKRKLLEESGLVCRHCGIPLHLVNFKQRGYLKHGGAIAGGELSCPRLRWWKVWEHHELYWVEVDINGWRVFEHEVFRHNLVDRGYLTGLPWYEVLRGKRYC